MFNFVRLISLLNNSIGNKSYRIFQIKVIELLQLTFYVVEISTKYDLFHELKCILNNDVVFCYLLKKGLE